MTESNGTGRAGTPLPLAVVLLTLNEAHNMAAVLDTLEGLAEQVFVVDSFSSDATLDIALRRGAHVVQREFKGFGDQWNFALRELPITAAWTMKLDPDERISPRLAASLRAALDPGSARGAADAYSVARRLWFLGKPLPARQRILRVWRTGTCRFSDVLVNEHPLVTGRVEPLEGDLEHHDSPSLTHWYDKQNRYTTAEAMALARGESLSARAALLGSSLERQMWLKKHFRHIPLRFGLLFWAHLLGRGAWRAGREGLIWARLRTEVYRMVEYKAFELARTGEPLELPWRKGTPDPRVDRY
jgi:glycosyltransferase involved in cell wall biosynthesis